MISQRELRNDSARVLREVSSGQSFTITNRGEPVAQIVPIDVTQPALRITRPATRRGGWAELAKKRVQPTEPLESVLADLKEDRV